MLSGQFHQARLKLTLIYVAILAIILLLSSGSIYSMFSTRLDFRFARFRPRSEMVFPPDIIPPTPADVRADLIYSLIMVNGLLLIAAGISSYWLAGITLQPIQTAYNRQRRFLSDASHELRTPLAILQIDLENELANGSAQTAHREKAESHLEEVERMSRIVNDLLILSRLDENGGVHYKSVNLNLSEVIQETVDRMQPIAKHFGVFVNYSQAEKNIEVLANKELLIQAFSNVIKNAITYNKEGGGVAILSKIENNQALVAVVDTGVGMAKEDLDKIFDRFYRTDNSRSRQTGGSGLGLAIVKSIINQLHGSIKIESTLGSGTTVTMHIPIVKAS